LPAFRAGQHLPLELHLPGGFGKVQRSYSLSGDPSDGRYRISVKREAQGLVSRILHDVFPVGGFLDAGRPSGDFALPDAKSPLVLASAGIGITPLLSMLHQLAGEEGTRPVWFVHSARDGDHHAFRKEVQALAKDKPNVQIITHYTRPLPSDVPGYDFDHAGRISAAGLVALSGRADTRYLLCGPAVFLAELEEGLQREGVLQEQIRFESF
jgi:ferredoxin-NADP reductase